MAEFTNELLNKVLNEVLIIGDDEKTKCKILNELMCLKNSYDDELRQIKYYDDQHKKTLYRLEKLKNYDFSSGSFDGYFCVSRTTE